MSNFGPCSQVGEALALLFRACRSSLALTRLAKGLMVDQLDATVFVAQEQGLDCPAVGVLCSALLASCMFCGARCGFVVVQVFTRFPLINRAVRILSNH